MDISDTKIDALGRMCHSLIKGYCESIGDRSLPSWEYASDEMKEATLVGVKGMLANPDMTSEEAHNQWMQRKLDNGWTKGDVKDEDAKTHPSLIPYNELSASERFKDYLFRGVVLMYMSFTSGEGV